MSRPFLCSLTAPVDLNDVSLIHDAHLDIILSAKQENEALSFWNETNTNRTALNLPTLMDMPLYRPARIQRNNHRISIYSGMISYRQNLFLSRPISIWKPDHFLGAGLSIVPVCADGEILIGRRSRVVQNQAGRYHVAAGHAHPDETFGTATGELVTGALQEMQEEMELMQEDIIILKYLGIGLNKSTSKTEFLTRVRLKENAEFYIERWKHTTKNHKDREFDEITTLQHLTGRVDRQEDLLLHKEKFTTAGLMALHAHFSAKFPV